MYFSTIRCHPGDPEVLSIWDPYEVHRFVWQLFETEPDASRDFLYRYDLERGRPRFYLLSQRPPKPRGAFWCAKTKGFRPLIQAGDRLVFSLRANPVVCVQGKRHDVVMHRKKMSAPAGGTPDSTAATPWHEAGLVWLKPRAEGHGFRFDEGQLRVESYHRQTFRKKQGHIIITTLDFHGLLEVRDAGRFQRMLFNGLGPAKGFGCGLMLIRRA